MTSLIRFAAVLFVVVLMVSTSSCSNPPTPPAEAHVSEFSDVMDQLSQVARERSVDGTKITLGNPTEEPNGQRVLTAQRVTDQGTTEYTMRFVKSAASWVCVRADAQEVEKTGGKFSFNMEGNGIEIEQLVTWLKW